MLPMQEIMVLMLDLQWQIPETYIRLVINLNINFGFATWSGTSHSKVYPKKCHSMVGSVIVYYVEKKVIVCQKTTLENLKGHSLIKQKKSMVC